VETLYCHPELVSGSLDILIYIDSEIEDPVLKLVQDDEYVGVIYSLQKAKFVPRASDDHNRI